MSVAQLEQVVTNAPLQRSKSRSEWSQSWRRFRANRAALIGLFFIILLCILAIFANVLVPYDPNYSYPGMRGMGPSWGHPMGFDHIGRDLMARVIYGTRVALLVGIGSTLISVVLGVLVGALAGYFGGGVDTVLSRIVDTLMAFPLLVLLIVLAFVLGPGLGKTITVIGVTTWATFSRVVRCRCHGAAQERFCDGGARWRRAGFTHYLSPYVAQCLGAGDCLGDLGGWQHYHLGIVALLSGAWHPAADRFVGRHFGRWPFSYPPISSDYLFPWGDDLLDSSRLQPAG